MPVTPPTARRSMPGDGRSEPAGRFLDPLPTRIARPPSATRTSTEGHSPTPPRRRQACVAERVASAAALSASSVRPPRGGEGPRVPPPSLHIQDIAARFGQMQTRLALDARPSSMCVPTQPRCPAPRVRRDDCGRATLKRWTMAPLMRMWLAYDSRRASRRPAHPRAARRAAGMPCGGKRPGMRPGKRPGCACRGARDLFAPDTHPETA